MQVQIEKRYPIPVDAERAWSVLHDLHAVAGCMPGAAITEQSDDTHYKGTVKVKIGPAVAAFAGDIEVRRIDPETRSIELHAKGADRAGSSAAMDLTARLQPDGDAAVTLEGLATVKVNGKFAQFGSRMMTQVADMILDQFVDNFRAAAAARPSLAAVPGAAAGAPAQAPAGAPAGPAPPPAVPREINGLAILWMLIRSWVARLFGRGR